MAELTGTLAFIPGPRFQWTGAGTIPARRLGYWQATNPFVVVELAGRRPTVRLRPALLARLAGAGGLEHRTRELRVPEIRWRRPTFAGVPPSWRRARHAALVSQVSHWQAHSHHARLEGDSKRRRLPQPCPRSASRSHSSLSRRRTTTVSTLIASSHMRQLSAYVRLAGRQAIVLRGMPGRRLTPTRTGRAPRVTAAVRAADLMRNLGIRYSCPHP